MKVIKNNIVIAAKKVLKLGLNIGSEGNLSFRDKDVIYITPSGVETTKLNDRTISEVKISGEIQNGIKPSSEVFMHLYIYKNFKEINSIVHCHSMWSSILSCLRLKIPSFHYMVAEFGGEDIRCSKYATFGTERLAQNVLKSLEHRKGCLLANHGQLTISNSVEDALHLAESLEKLSKQFFFCSLTNKMKILNKKNISKVLSLFDDYKSKR